MSLSPRRADEQLRTGAPPAAPARSWCLDREDLAPLQPAQRGRGVASDDVEPGIRQTQLETRLEQRAEDQEHNIRVFTIAYGGQANKAVLKSIAAASDGQAYEGDPEQIAKVYREISSFF